MTKFTKEHHNAMMSAQFTQESLDKILAWLDKKITGLKGHKEMMNVLVKLYQNLPETKQTKTYLYQVLVLNGLIDDGKHDKSFCNQKKDCNILKYYKEKYGNIDTLDICWNLNACLFLPGLNIQPPFLLTDYDELKLEI